LTGLLKVVLPDPQPLAWWDLEVVEPAHQPQIAEIHAMALVGLSDRRSRVVQLLHAELDAGPILIAQQQGLAELGPGAAATVPGRLGRAEQQVQVVVLRQ
jgi:hypothetical protein